MKTKQFLFCTLLLIIVSCSKKSNDINNNNNINNNFTCSDITSNTTISPGTYIVDCNVTITNNAVLTISPGVNLKFTGNGGFTTSNGGAIRAEGTSASPIVFTGFEETSGYWYGVDIYTNSLNNVFKYCQFKFGGKGSRSMVRIGDASTINLGRATFQNCSFSNGLKNGMFIAGNSFLSNSTNNSFTGNQQYPISTELACLDSISGSNSFTGNNSDYIYVSDDYQIFSNVHFHKLNVPFYLNATSNNAFEINSDWTIDPGVQIVMGSNLKFEIEEAWGSYPAGSFNCLGISSDPIIIRGFQSVPGYWNKIRFMGSTSTNNKIVYTHISDGGSNAESPYNSDPGMITLYSDGAYGANKLSINNCQVSNSSTYGIFVIMGQGATVNGFTSTATITPNLTSSSRSEERV
jgi:hypothetical protein